MRKQVFSTLLPLLVLGTLGIAYGMLPTEQGDKEAAEHRAIGTWKLVSAKYGDQELEVAKLGTTLEHISPTSFVWLSYDTETKVVSRTAGGTYTLKGDQFEETPQYGFGGDFDIIRDCTYAGSYAGARDRPAAVSTTKAIPDRSGHQCCSSG